MEADRQINLEWTLSDQEFYYFRDLIGQIAGISLSENKKDLVKSRLCMYIQSLNLKSFESYLQFLQSLPPESHYWQEFVNLLTTNKTDFFREAKHFDYIIDTFIPEWLLLNEPVLKVWSAAASSGEEAYTLAVILKKHLPAEKDFQILATDIDTQILESAKNGVYSVNKLEEIPAEYQKDNVSIGTGDVAGWFRFKQNIKNKITFHPHNLLENDLKSEGTFDLIFCRNVMIYFAKPTIQSVVENLAKRMSPKGLLFIGHSETLQGLGLEWKSVSSSVYKRNLEKGST